MFRHALSFALISTALAAAPAAAANWVVNKAASRIAFRSSFAGTGFDGQFRRWDANVAFDPKALATSKVVVSVDLASAATGDSSRDQALPSADWFNAGKFPRAVFTSTGFQDKGGGRYVANGTLSMRGVTKPVSLPFTLAINGADAQMKGALVIDRNAFGVGQGQFKAADTVPYGVTVTVTVSAKRQ